MFMRLPSSFNDSFNSFKIDFDEQMKAFKNQIHQFYNETVLNPYVSNSGVNLNEAIKYIENRMKKLGWTKNTIIKSNDSTYNFFNDSDSIPDSEPVEDIDVRINQWPVQKIINIGKLNPDINQDDPNDSFGVTLFRFWKTRLENNTDKILAQVAIGILNAFCTFCSAEHLFSMAGRVLTRNRMRLMAYVAECQVIIMANAELANQYAEFD